MTTTQTPAARVSGTIKALQWETNFAAPDIPHSYATHGDDEDGWQVSVCWRTCSEWLNDGQLFATEAAAKAAAQADYDARILAAIQPDPEPVLLDETSLRARIGDISNQVHNLACRHQNDEDLCVNLGELSSQLWELARNSPTAPSSAGTVSVAATFAHLPLLAALSLVEQSFKDGIAAASIIEITDPDDAWQRSKARAALRALAGEGER